MSDKSHNKKKGILKIMTNDLITMSKINSKTMTSREIADLTGKQHAHVMRDIKDLVFKGAIAESNFGLSDYKDSSGKTNPMYDLDFSATMILVTGYDAKRRSMIVNRWIELETGKATPAYMMAEPERPINYLLPELQAGLEMAKLFGLSGNQAVLSANHAIKTCYGMDCMAMMNINGLVKEDKTQYFTPTILGKTIGVSAVKLNKMLQEAGLQKEERDGKNNLIWNVTDKGKAHCEMIDTGKKHNGGAPVLQVKWAESVLEYCPMN